MEAALILMNRVPESGQTKTRLESHLKKDECNELYQAFLKDINLKLLNFKSINSKIDLYFCFTSKESGAVFSEVIDNQFTCIPQQGKSLGEKLFNALNDAQQLSELPVIIIVSDIPFLDIDILAEALAGLKERDLVIGPQTDGGYYLIGMKKTRKILFDFEKWVNLDVLDKTIKKASKYNLKIHFLPELSNVNTFKELLELRSKLQNKQLNLNYSKNTCAVMEKIFEYK